MDIRAVKWISYLTLFVALLTACTSLPIASTASPTPADPSAALLAAPDPVCGTATQVRVQLQVSENLPSEDPGAWELTGPGEASITKGDWIVRDGAVLIPFPDNAPLPSGDYTLHLRWRDAELAAHTFSIGPPHPTIQMLDVSVIPGGKQATALWMEAPLHLFYINFVFEGACAGTPYWISTRNAAGETVCTHNGILESMDGEGTAACYGEEATPFEIGKYEATLTLPGEISRRVSFEIAAPEPTATPPPTQTPRPPDVACEDGFAAAGITPEGEPFLPGSIFDWYTVTVYAGMKCRNVQAGTQWRATWNRGEVIAKETQGVWEGPPTGLVWDVLTGVPTNPFVTPGTYTVTLEIGGNSSEATFTVYEYPPRSTD